MTSQHDKPKRWRPRFSVRTLIVVVTLICCYAACWGPTKRQGIDDVMYHVSGYRPNAEPTSRLDAEVAAQMARGLAKLFGEAWDASATLPPLVSVTQRDGKRHNYCWFFGYVAKLPFEREISVSPSRDTSEFVRHVND